MLKEIACFQLGFSIAGMIPIPCRRSMHLLFPTQARVSRDQNIRLPEDRALPGIREERGRSATRRASSRVREGEPGPVCATRKPCALRNCWSASISVPRSQSWWFSVNDVSEVCDAAVVNVGSAKRASASAGAMHFDHACGCVRTSIVASKGHYSRSVGVEKKRCCFPVTAQRSASDFRSRGAGTARCAHTIVSGAKRSDLGAVYLFVPNGVI